MFKLLLYILMSLSACYGFSQNATPEWSGPSDIVVEDPNKAIVDLEVKTEKSGVVVSWKVNGDQPDFFAIERSNNGKKYQVIAVLNKLPAKPDYHWADDAPEKGKCAYRIRYSYNQGPALYSGSASAVIAGSISFKFYPNPVDHILIVRSEMPLDVLIADANGKVRITTNRVQGLHTINVSDLEKGIYLIRFINKLTNVISQEKLIKN